MPKYQINSDLNFVELYFDSKPNEEMRETLKNNGWRWFPQKKCWYNFNSEASLSFAKKLCKPIARPTRPTRPSLEKGARKQPTQKEKKEQIIAKTPVQVNEWVEGILNRIRNNDHFPEFHKIHSRNLRLMDHQKAGAIIAEQYNRFAFFYDTGTGKTVMTLNIIAEKYNSNKAGFLIIAPKPLIKNAWLDDAQKYFPTMRILPLSSNITFDDYRRLYNRWSPIYTWEGQYGDYKRRDKIMSELMCMAQHFIVNIDQIRSKEKAEQLLKQTHVRGIIIDESSILKNYDSQSSRRVRVITKDMDYVYLLSGKPAPNSLVEYFSQMKIVDPDTFSMGIDAFKAQYFMQRGQYKLVPKNQYSERNVTRMIGQRSIIVRKEECIDLPAKTSIKRSVDLDKDTWVLYSAVLNNFVTEIIAMDGSSTTIYSMSKLGRIAKLREIACGFYLDEGDRYHVSSEKNSSLISLLEDEIGTEEQVIIWCNFQYEIETIEEELKHRGYSVVTAYGKSKNLDNNIQAFKNGNAQYMIAHPKTLKYGVTFTNCHYAVYNSLSYSYEDYYQSHDRIYRNGQQKKCFFYHLLSSDTIDELIYENLGNKHMSAKVFEDLIKKASKFGVKQLLIEKASKVKQQTIERATSIVNVE